MLLRGAIAEPLFPGQIDGFADSRRLARGVVTFKGPVDEASIASAIDRLEVVLSLTEDSSTDQGESASLPISEDGRPIITIAIDSPGGSVSDGLKFINELRSLEERGYVVRTVCLAECASMGAAILAAGTKGYRDAHSNSRIMLHAASAGVEGKLSEMTEGVGEMLDSVVGHLYEFLASRMDLDQRTLVHFMANDDEWLQAEDAVVLGLIERIDGEVVDKEALLTEYQEQRFLRPETVRRQILDLTDKLGSMKRKLVSVKIQQALREQEGKRR